jgi:hypothetical protein
MVRRTPARRGRSLIASTALSGLVFVSGCSLLLDLDVSQAGPCVTTADCPATQVCVHAVCSSDVPADASVADGGAMSEASAPTADVSEATPSDACSSGDPEATACSVPDAGSDDAGCAACDPQASMCIDGTCRTLDWVSPESEYAEPEPAPYGQRQFFSVPWDELFAVQIRVSSSGLLVRLGMLASTDQVPTLFWLGLYSDDGGYPQHPLFESAVQLSAVRGSATGRQELTVSPPLRVAAGTAYWIAFVSQQDDFVLQSTGNQILTASVSVPDAGSPWQDPFAPTANLPMAVAMPSIILYATIAVDPH